VILFSNLLNLELKSLIFSSELAFELERSLIRDEIVWSSPNLAMNYSSNMSQLVIDPVGNEKYHDPADPWRL